LNFPQKYSFGVISDDENSRNRAELKAFITTGYHNIHNEQLFRHLLDNFLRKTFAIPQKLLFLCRVETVKGGRKSFTRQALETRQINIF
jgi:hypothetical protein